MPVLKVGDEIKGFKLVRSLGELAGAEGIPFEGKAPDGSKVFIKQFLRHKPRSPEGPVFLKIQMELKTRLATISRFVSTIKEVFQHENSFVQVAEWVVGTSLSEMSEKLSFEKRYLIATLISFAVKSVHQVGIAHLDLKPGNVMIERRRLEDERKGGDIVEVARLIDFDAAVIIGTPRTSDCLGTPPYMSPEHIRPKEFGLPERPADVFSLAIMIYELLVEYFPFEIDDFNEDGYFSRKKFIEVVKAHRITPLHHLNRNISAEVSEVIDACLVLNPEERPGADQIHDCLIKNQPEVEVADADVLPDPTSTALPEPIRKTSLILEWKYGQISVDNKDMGLIGRSDFREHLPEYKKHYSNGISRRHARCYSEGDLWRISRLSKYNHMKVNDKPVELLGYAKIRNGDQISLGPIRLTAILEG